MARLAKGVKPQTKAERAAYEKGWRVGRSSAKHDPPPPSFDLHSPEKLLLKQIYEKLHVVFLQIKNLYVEISQLRAEQTKLRSVVLTLLADPQAREDAMAVIKKFNQERGQ